MALSGVQVVLDDQAAGHRAAHQGAGDQAEGGGRQSGHVGAGRSAGLYQLRTVGRGSGGAADQSGGADADADEGVLAEGQHDAAAQSILDGDHNNGQNQDQNHGLAAAEQGRDADGEADMLTVKPTVVKNRFWNTVCRVPSKVMLATPLTVRMQLMIENSRPPTRGAGIQ